jgi:predicted transcriptional regulator
MTDFTERNMSNAIRLVAEIVSAYVSNHAVSATDLPGLISRTHSAMQSLSVVAEQPAEDLKPAVPIKKSVTPDYIVCLDDGKRFKSMKRHLAGLGMTPVEYRARWELASDYPMVAPNYAATRSALAKSNGLGRTAAVINSAPPKRTKAPKASA